MFEFFWGELITGKNKLSTCLNYKFSSLGSYLGTSRPYSNNLSANTNQLEALFQPISKYDYIKTINVSKPLRPCCITAWALKDCCLLIAEHLTFFINAFIFERRFPSHLKRAHITPIHKKGLTETSEI